MRNHLHLYLNGQSLRVTGEDAFLPLADFLRRRQRLTGTKIVCAEGDCGSCTVLVGRPQANHLHYSAVTSCIQLMFQLDATHIITIEGLRTGDTLNPIQQSLVQCQGTQCGFCTPGFVVSLYDLMQDRQPHNPDQIRRALVGNLCRCTGYDSIVRAATTTNPTTVKTLNDLYPPAPLLQTLTPAATEEVFIESPPRRFYKPTTIDQAVRFRTKHPTATLISGATDIGVQLNKRTRDLTTVLTTSALPNLSSITADDTHLHVGATATLTAFERAAAQHLPELASFLALFGSPPIKNAATLAGNLANASPIGDTIPPLFALAAMIDLAGPAGQRTLPIESFYTGYRQTALQPGELITAIHIPLPKPRDHFKLYKVSRRKDLDISTFNAAIHLQLSAGVIQNLRIAYGGVAPIVLRMRKTESVLKGHPPTLDLFQQAAQVAANEVTPITDVRGSQTYRRTLAHNILLKFWYETLSNGTDENANGTPTPGSELKATTRIPVPQQL